MWVHFLADARLRAFAENSSPEDLDVHWHRFTNSRWAWIVQTAVILRAAGVEVSLGAEAEPGCINLGLANDWRIRAWDPSIFAVSIDADQLRVRWAQASFVQNQMQSGARAFWLPHWPQPGLIGRAEDRDSFRNVAFFGLPRNLYRDESWWHETCAQHAMQFSIRKPPEWNDYHDVDIAIGIRQMTRKGFHNKPPTKLFNAWLAGCVFIGGWDSAYQQVGLPGTNYIAARTEVQLHRCLEQLRHDPHVGHQMIEEGRHCAENVGSRASTCARWIDLLERTIVPEFERWQKWSGARKRSQFWWGSAVDLSIRSRNAVWRNMKKLVRW